VIAFLLRRPFPAANKIIVAGEAALRRRADPAGNDVKGRAVAINVDDEDQR
jgi:hypothetical protein